MDCQKFGPCMPACACMYLCVHMVMGKWGDEGAGGQTVGVQHPHSPGPGNSGSGHAASHATLEESAATRLYRLLLLREQLNHWGLATCTHKTGLVSTLGNTCSISKSGTVTVADIAIPTFTDPLHEASEIQDLRFKTALLTLNKL